LVRRFVQSYLGTPERPVPFGGRDSAIRLLNDWLESDSSQKNLLITAPAGRGKTALLVRWIEQLRADWSLAFVPISIRYETNRAPVFYQALASRLAEILGEALPGTPADPAIYYKDKAIEYLDRLAPAGKPCLVVIDGLDEASGWRVDTTVLPSSPSGNIKIAVSARQLAGDRGSTNWLHRLGWLDDESTITYEVPPLQREGIADVLVKMGFPLGDLAGDVDIVSELHRLTEQGDPLLLELYVKDLWKKGKEAARLKPKDLAGLTPGFGAYFERWFDEQEKAWKASEIEINKDTVNGMLAILACAAGPLTLNVMDDLLEDLQPARRIITAQSIEPLERFVVGDGIENGYALAHPKLAEYLERDYFGGSRVLTRTKRAFIDWGRRQVDGLNAGEIGPQKKPHYEYALLHYTQHLAGLPAIEAIPLFRDLIEDGWRRAWRTYEGGYQGFARDVQLASKAFAAAAEKDVEKLKAPRTGLGGLIRCMLCLSSIRSAGMAMPGSAIAEFLRDEVLGPKEALNLLQLKRDKDKVEAIGAIVPWLPVSLRLEVYAGARDISNPDLRYAALVAMAPHLPTTDADKAYVEAFHIAMDFGEESRREAAYKDLESRLPASFGAEAKRAEAERRQTELRQARMAQVAAADEPIALSPEPDPEPGMAPPAVDLGQLFSEASRSEPTSDRYRETLEQIRGTNFTFENRYALNSHQDDLSSDVISALLAAALREPGYDARQALMTLAPLLSRDQIDDVVVRIRSMDEYEAARVFNVLIPYLGDRVFPLALELAFSPKTSWGWSETRDAIAAGASRDQLDAILQKVSLIDDQYSKSKALASVMAHLPQDLLAPALAMALQLPDYHQSSMFNAVASRLTENTLRELVDPICEAGSVPVLKELAPHLPADLLPRVLHFSETISDMENRGALLAAVLPRMRELAVPIALSDVYESALIIGDRSIEAFALAALLPYMAPSTAEAALARVSDALKNMARTPDETEAVTRCAALMLIAPHLSPAEAKIAHDQALAVLAHVREVDVGKLLRAFLRLRGAQLADDPVDPGILMELRTLDSNNPEGGSLRAVLAPLLSGDDASALLQEARAVANLIRDEDGRILVNALIALATIAADGQTQDERRAILIGLPRQLSALSDDDGRAIMMTAIVNFSPSLPQPDWTTLITEALAVVDRQKEPANRATLAALMAPYLPESELRRRCAAVLDVGARSPRPGVLAVLALTQGLAGELYPRNTVVAGNRIPGSALARLGGAAAVEETTEAIRDICRWWP
jgi:hypothetical protein